MSQAQSYPSPAVHGSQPVEPPHRPGPGRRIRWPPEASVLTDVPKGPQTQLFQPGPMGPPIPDPLLSFLLECGAHRPETWELPKASCHPGHLLPGVPEAGCPRPFSVHSCQLPVGPQRVSDLALLRASHHLQEIQTFLTALEASMPGAGPPPTSLAGSPAITWCCLGWGGGGATSGRAGLEGWVWGGRGVLVARVGASLGDGCQVGVREARPQGACVGGPTSEIPACPLCPHPQLGAYHRPSGSIAQCCRGVSVAMATAWHQGLLVR